MDFSRSSCPMEKKSALFNLSSRKWLVGAMSLKSNECSEVKISIQYISKFKRINLAKF